MTIGDQVLSKTTGILKMETGNTKNWPSGAAAIFTGPTGTPAGEELFVIATVYEDDSLGVVGVLNLLEPLAEAALVAYVEAKRKANKEKALTPFQIAALKVAVKASVAGIMKSLIASGILTKAIGTDSMTVLPNGTIVSDTGGNKTTMDFRRVANGKTRSQYKLLGFVADVQ